MADFGAERAAREGRPKGRTSKATRCSARRAPNRHRVRHEAKHPHATCKKRSTQLTETKTETESLAHPSANNSLTPANNTSTASVSAAKYRARPASSNTYTPRLCETS